VRLYQYEKKLNAFEASSQEIKATAKDPFKEKK